MEKYENLGLVGEGSYGIVMKCRHKATGTLVAIKKFLESEDDKIVKRIATREIKMLRLLRHENLVNLIDVFKRRKKLYLVFEFVDYTLLDDLEKYPGGLEDNYAKRILFQVLRGIEFCHNNDVIHRDIKPENILVSKSGVVKLCDFGFARPIAGTSTSFTDYVATRWYRAPELLVGDTKYGRPVDVWAIGCLTSEIYTGDPLFPGDSDIDQLFHIIRCIGSICPKHIEIFRNNALFKGLHLPQGSAKVALDKKYPKLSKDVLYLIKRCLDPTPENRPTCTELLHFELFDDKFSEQLLTEIRVKVQRERDKNPLLKNNVSNVSPNQSKNENDSPPMSQKILNNKPPVQIKHTSNFQKIQANNNYKLKSVESTSPPKISEMLDKQIEFVANFSDNSTKAAVIVDEESWENVRPLTSRKERVASRAGRATVKCEEIDNAKVSDENSNKTPFPVSDTPILIENDKTSFGFYSEKDQACKPFIGNTDPTLLPVKQQDISANRISSSPRNIDSPVNDSQNDFNKPTFNAFTQFKTADLPNLKTSAENKTPTLDSNINYSSPSAIDMASSQSSHYFPMPTNKKPNHANNNSPVITKSTIGNYPSMHQPLTNNSLYNNYSVKHLPNSLMPRNAAMTSENNNTHSYFPNIGKDSKSRPHNLYLSTMPQTNSNNAFKSTNTLMTERSGFYFKKKPMVNSRPNLISYQDNMILPELKGAEMTINRNQTYSINSKYKYVTPKSNFNAHETHTNGKSMDNILSREP